MRGRLVLGMLAYALLTAMFVALDPFGADATRPAEPCGLEERRGFKTEEEQAREARCGETVAEMGRELTEPADAMLRRQLFGADVGAVPGKVFARASAQAAEIGQQTAASDPEAAGEPWKFVGPVNIGGRVLDVVVDPTTPNAVYAATATGGVWRSTNSGSTFTAAWPADRTQAIGALAAAPDGTLFAGTGEAGPGGGSITYGGTGVYRSADRGGSWQRVGLPESGRIGRIVVDPADPRRIYVAATGSLFKAGGERGLYVSENGGDSWTRVLAGANDTTGAVDVAVDPKDPRVVYAAMWDHLRTPTLRRYEGLGSGLYRSADAGKTWARVGTPIFGPRPELGRIGVAVGPDRAVYAITTGATGRYSGLFKSADGGASWTMAQPSAGLIDSSASFGWWFGRVYVDPQDADHVFVAGLTLQESTDGGVNFSGGGAGVHADQHGMAWDPRVPGRVYLGNDGGVYRSDDNGVKWAFGKSMPWSQFYSLDVSEQEPARIVGGLQDNGSNRSWGNPGGKTWVSYHGGDGERTLIKPTNKNVIYGCAQYGVCARSDNGGVATTALGEQVSGRFNWFTPIEFDPENPDTIYSGGDILNRSEDQGDTFVPISPILSSSVTDPRNPEYKDYGTITTIAPAGRSKKTIYAGTDDGNLWYTHDDGLTWTKAADPDLPKAWVTRVEVDRANPNTAYATYSGLRQAEDSAYVLKTTDGGVSWTDISANLPKAPLNDVNLIDGTVVVASDVGVFFRRAGETSWSRLGTGLPLAPVFELRHHRGTDTLFVASFGRGVWSVGAAVLRGQ